MSDAHDVTVLLNAWKVQGDEAARDRLFELLRRELHAIAASRLREVPGLQHKLEPAELVNELYVRLANYGVSWANRHLFFGMVSEIMRGILIDHLRRARAQKRPPTSARVMIESFDLLPRPADAAGADFEALYLALDRLRALAPKDAEVFEQHVILGQTIRELVAFHGSSSGTVKRQLRRAKTWLAHSLAS